MDRIPVLNKVDIRRVAHLGVIIEMLIGRSTRAKILKVKLDKLLK